METYLIAGRSSFVGNINCSKSIYSLHSCNPYLSNRKRFNSIPNVDLGLQIRNKDNSVKYKKQFTEPVVIGGVGGSGTRIVAELLKQMNYYIGNDLNVANDNLAFVILLNRAKWFLENNEKNEEDIMKRFNIFERIMTGCFKPEKKELMYIIDAAKDCIFYEINSGEWRTERINKILESNKVDVSKYSGWGWKDPAMYLFLKPMKEYFKTYKYIHVIRHGLDMAYSKNILHLSWFGRLFGLGTPKNSAQLAKALLKFWIKANNETINNAKQILGENFLLVNFDELCLNPVKQINKILDFLEIDKSKIDTNKLYLLPQKVESIGRYREHDLSIFDKREIEEVKKLGFKVDR